LLGRDPVREDRAEQRVVISATPSQPSPSVPASLPSTSRATWEPA
jgi:hypothetical protein